MVTASRSIPAQWATGWAASRRISALYKLEELIRGKPPDERRHVRQAQAVPLLDDMKRWLEATLATLSAIQYALNRWSALVYYCSDGRAEIDNLIAERASAARCRVGSL
jgi:hypothetical protein